MLVSRTTAARTARVRCASTLGPRLTTQRQSPRAWPAASSRSSWRALTTTSLRRRADVFSSQLENTPNSADLLSSLTNKAAPSTGTPQTLSEKIIQRHSVGLPEGKKVKAGDYVTLKPAHFMSHDNTFPIMTKFFGLGATQVRDPSQLVITLDHDIQSKTESNLKKYAAIEAFAEKQGVFFSPAGAGIGHQRVVEEGFALPGSLTVASDSHSNMYGALSNLGTPVVRTDGAAIYSTSKTWFQIPPIAKVTFTGILPPGVSGKDVIVALCGTLSSDEVLNHFIEFSGSEETLRSLPIDHRLTISNMTTEWGALSGLFPVDPVLISWLRAKATTSAMFPPKDGAAPSRFTHEMIEELIQNPLQADSGCQYAKEFYLNLSTLSPTVAGPNSVRIATPVRKLEAQDIAIQKAYLVSCTNSRFSDISSAARVFKEAASRGESAKVKDGVKFYIAAASLAEQKMAEESGDWQTLIDAGADALPSGCGPCIGLGRGLLEKGEVGISASNRNFKNRMGEGIAYLASPEVVAASALQGKIAGPGWYEKPDGVEKVIVGEGSGDYEADKATSIEDALDKIIAEAESLIATAEKDTDSPNAVSEDETVEETLTDILPGFPEKVEGEIVFLDADSINTDGIYPGKYTYQDDVSTERMAEICMENYDPEFRNIAKEGDIVVSGFSFGCGSSREQAATAILAKKIPLVVAGSFGNIFSRNAINNALMTVEVPKLIQRLRETFKTDDKEKKVLTRRTGWKFVWDVRRSKVIVTEKGGETWSQKVGELPPNVQEIIAKGGLENWVKSQIGN